MRRYFAPIKYFTILMAYTLAACTPSLPTATAIPSPTDPPPTATLTAAPPTSTSTATVELSETPLPSTTAGPQFAICSPLQDIRLDELEQPDLLKTTFNPPRPGMDDGHMGVDFSYWTRGERTTMQGHPVQSVLNGRVTAVLPNRLPYGYAVIIETALDHLPADFITQSIPTPAPTVPPAPNLSACPADLGSALEFQDGGSRSLYLLYAHLNEQSPLQPGQEVSCGQVIGSVGDTGLNIVNHHLHLETRVGPSAAVFPEMAFYDASASELARANYCTWRVSGLFQMFDPLSLLSLQP